MPRVDFGVLRFNMVLRFVSRELVIFFRTANALINANFNKLLLTLSILSLVTANPLSNNQTEQLTTPHTLDDDGVLPTRGPNPIALMELANLPTYRTVLMPVPCPVNETEQNATTSNDNESQLSLTDASSNNDTRLSTPRICYKNVTMQLDSSDNSTRPTMPTTCLGNETLTAGDGGTTPRSCVVEIEPTLSPLNNNVTIETECRNASMMIYMNFTRPFQGVVYPKKFIHMLPCNFIALPSTSDKEATLELPYGACGTRVRQSGSSRVRVSSTLVIQQHNMLSSRFDIIQNVSCMLQVPLDDVRLSDYNPLMLPVRKVVPWIEVFAGSDLFPTEEFRPEGFIESALYIVVKVADRGVHRDMVIRNCIGHDRRFISNNTVLYQMSDYYGCSDNSSMLGDFGITNETGAFSDMMSFAMIKNFSMFARGQLYISCGVNVCKGSCQRNCDKEESERLRGFSTVVFKKMVMRGPGVTTPSTLRLNTDDDVSHRVKRSVLGVFSNVLAASGSFLSNLVGGTDNPLLKTETTLTPELDLERNESTEFEANTQPIDAESTSEQAILNQSMLSATIVPPAMYKSKQNSDVVSTKMSVVQRKIFSRQALQDNVAAEVFIFIGFCLMATSYICVVRSKAPEKRVRYHL